MPAANIAPTFPNIKIAITKVAIHWLESLEILVRFMTPKNNQITALTMNNSWAALINLGLIS